MFCTEIGWKLLKLDEKSSKLCNPFYFEQKK